MKRPRVQIVVADITPESLPEVAEVFMLGAHVESPSSCRFTVTSPWLPPDEAESYTRELLRRLNQADERENAST